MNMTLYHGEPSGPSFTVLTALEETGIEAKRVRINLAGLERHELAGSAAVEVAMSIEGEGPVLIVDGEAMADSVFIACFLDDMAPGNPLRPTDPYARWEVMTWCRQIIERLAPAAALLGCQAHCHPLIRAWTEDEYAAKAARIVSEDLRARWDMCRAGSFDDAQVTDSRVKIVQAVEKCEAQLSEREWLFGDHTIADIETYAWLAGMPAIVPDAFSRSPLTTAWLERVRSRPSVQRVLLSSSVTAPESIWAPGPEINRWG